GYQATKYLIDNGHKDILILCGPSYISSARERLAGYKRAFMEARLKIKPKLIREIPITSGGCTGVFANFLQEKIRFSAIVGFSDMIIWDVWTCLQNRGYHIPRDFSLVGFDNIQSRLAIPFQLSTISTYKAKLSSTAVDCLYCLIHGEQHKHSDCHCCCHHVIDTQLISGETVKKLKSHG
ncbi:MAG: substrate-binding domain-containing protein, partial [Holophagales bacterium]|nr:substrate-binding domain-containing protein [Holophagales bacterium]